MDAATGEGERALPARLLRQVNRYTLFDVQEMAGVLGFEPRNGEIKTRCLTAWRYPNHLNCCNVEKRGDMFSPLATNPSSPFGTQANTSRAVTSSSN